MKKTKQIISILLAVIMIACSIPMAASAESYSGEYSGYNSNVTWSLDTETGVLKIEGSGEMDNDYVSPWYNYRDCVKTVEIADGVTSIGSYAFWNCSSLTSIAIPDSVTSIGEYAFYDCSSLTSIAIPDSVTSIGYQAFYDCSSLTSVTIGKGLRSIGDAAFSRCSNLTSVTISDGVTEICDKAFYECSNLTSVVIPSSVTRICDSAFWGCRNLKDIYYSGSEAEWNQVEIGGNNYFLTRATVHSTGGHSFTNYVSDNNATCTADGTKTAKCDNCNTTDTVADVGSAKGHSYKVGITDATCERDGLKLYVCHCGDTYSEVIPATGHTDTDNNGKCDTCGKQLSETPDEPTPPDIGNCDCLCHKSGFAGFIWNIVKAFYKMFNANKTCACGVAHY